MDVRILRCGWVRRHAAPDSPHVSARVNENVVNDSESNVPDTRIDVTWAAISAAHRSRSAGRRARRIAIDASVMPVTCRPANAATPTIPR